TDLARQRDEQAQQRRRRQLTPEHTAAPAVVAIEVDGGRLRTRAEGAGPGVHAAQSKEDKVACLVTLTDVEAAADPCPEPPPSFIEPRRIQRLVQKMAGQAGDGPAAPEPPETDLLTPDTTATDPGAADPAAEPW